MAEAQAVAVQRRMVEALARGSTRAPGPWRIIETHISLILLDGRHAYKFKKPLDLGFLDFTGLAQRRHCCEEEVRLNRRLSPELYLAVVPVSGTPQAPVLGGAGEALEYAVKMREFPQDCLLDRRLAAARLDAGTMDRLAREVADFHARIERAAPDSPYGQPGAIEAPMRQNFAQLRPLLETAGETAALDRLEAWSRAEHERLAGVFDTRRRQGFVRECHGDLHVGNVALVDGRVRIFDCIEFNPQLRWIDVASEVAFFVMDLLFRGRPDFAFRFLNAYLEVSGDYAGCALLRYYMVYRALVRAKVAALRAAQSDPVAAQRASALADCRQHLALATLLSEDRRPALLITHGLSGSGKTTVSQAVLEAVGAIRLRSDVERKRLHALTAEAASGSAPGEGLYTHEAARLTYAELARLAAELTAAGFCVIVDAAFLQFAQRRLLRELALSRGIAFLILDCRAAPQTLRRRVAARALEGGDASEATLAVLERQRAQAQALRPEELAQAVEFDTERGVPGPALRRLRGLLESTPRAS